MALAAKSALHAVDLLDTACTSVQISRARLESEAAAVAWNTATSEVVVAGGAGPPGTLSVFRQALPGYAWRSLA